MVRRFIKNRLIKGIRKATGLRDHRETGTDTPDTVTLKVVMVGEHKAVLLKKREEISKLL